MSWRVEGDGPRFHIVDDDSEVIAECWSRGHALKLAATWEFMRACGAVAQTLEGDAPSLRQARELARAAMAKAWGEGA